MSAPAGWIAVSCEAADLIRAHPDVHPSSSKTDLDGRYGKPEVFTEWDVHCRKTSRPILREHRWPGPEGEPDAAPCEHYVPSAEVDR